MPPSLVFAALLVCIGGPTATALLICLEKWGALEWLQLNRGRWGWLPEWLPADCYFCLGFWLGLVTNAVLALIFGGPFVAVLVAALPTAALARKLFPS